MTGNLSKKKGFLGDITEGNLDYIASKLNTEYGKRLEKAEDSVSNHEAEIQTIITGTSIRNEMVDDALGTMSASIENLETTVKEKEDVSNKVMEADDDGQYYSGKKTEMRIYQVVDEHIVQDLNESREDRIPSVKAVSEAIKGMKPDIDLSEYATKKEVSAGLTDLNNHISLAYVSFGGLDSELRDYYKKSETNSIIDVINSELNERELTSNRVTVIDEMSMMQGPTYPTARAVFDFVNEKIGDIEISLENIITKYGLGGDAS